MKKPLVLHKALNRGRAVLGIQNHGSMALPKLWSPTVDDVNPE